MLSPLFVMCIVFSCNFVAILNIACELLVVSGYGLVWVDGVNLLTHDTVASAEVPHLLKVVQVITNPRVSNAVHLR